MPTIVKDAMQIFNLGGSFAPEVECLATVDDGNVMKFVKISQEFAKLAIV